MLCYTSALNVIRFVIIKIFDSSILVDNDEWWIHCSCIITTFNECNSNDRFEKLFYEKLRRNSSNMIVVIVLEIVDVSIFKIRKTCTYSELTIFRNFTPTLLVTVHSLQYISKILIRQNLESKLSVILIWSIIKIASK